MKIREFIEMVAAGNTEFQTIEKYAKRIVTALRGIMTPPAAKAANKDSAAELPPDPEEQNNDRAYWAAAALAFFTHETGEKPFKGIDREQHRDLMAQNLADLLCDLGHYCDRAGIDFQSQLRTARNHYMEETDRKGAQFSEVTAPAILDSRETAIILHGLRMIQETASGQSICRAGMCEHFTDCDEMTDEEIDDLCERINFGDIAAPQGRWADSL